MNTKLLHRLAWKELRSLRALWWALLAMAIALQFGMVWFFDPRLADRFPRKDWLFGVALTLPVIYAWACSAMSFSGEREDGTDHFLSRMAAPPLSLLGVKLGICVASTLTMFVVLYSLVLFVAGMVVPEIWYSLVPKLEHVPQWRLEALAWSVGFWSFGVFFSLVFHRVLPCLVATALATTALQWVPFALFGIGGTAVWLGWLLRLCIVPALSLLASTWLVQSWDECRWPRFVERLIEAWWRVIVMRSRRTNSALAAEQLSGGWRALAQPIGLFWPDEWLPAWRRETRRLLWLEWRQAWRVMAFVLAAFGVYVACQKLFVPWGSVLVAKEFPFVMALVSFVFGAWSFQAQQSGQRFRGFAGHGASPAAMWFIKQGTWFAVTLLTMVILASITAWLSGGRHFVYWEPDHESLWRRLGYGLSSGELAHWARHPQLQSESLGGVVSSCVLAVGLCFGVGQLVSLLMARAVTVATVGFVLAAFAFGWQQLTALAAIPPGLAVLPLIVGLLLASAVRMTDWLEERNSVRGWLRVIAACVVPSLVTLFGVPVYRVEEVPPIMSPEFESYDVRHLTADNVSSDAKEVGQWWLRLAESIQGEPIFPSDERERRATASPHWGDRHFEFVACDKLQNREWLTENSGLVSEMLRLAPQFEDCAFEADLFEGSNDRTANFRMKRLSQLAVLLKMSAKAAIADGKLDEGLQHYLVLLRLSEHMQQHAQLWPAHNGERLEVACWSFLIQWALHPAQTGDSLRAALGRSANGAPHPLLAALKKHVELLPSPEEVVAEEFSVTKQELAKSSREAHWPISWIFWERQRAERVLNYSAAVASENLLHWIKDSRENWEGDARLVKRSFLVHYPPTRKQMLAAFLQHSTLNPNADRHHPFVWSGEYTSDSQRVNARAEASVWRRGLVATLALRAFQLDHGRWPAQWDELIGPYLDRVPVDPWNGLPFELRPQGYPFEVEILGSRIPAHTPLFVSRGQYDQRFVPVVRAPADGETTPQTEWFAVGPYEMNPWPPKDREVVLWLIAFPLSATER